MRLLDLAVLANKLENLTSAEPNGLRFALPVHRGILQAYLADREDIRSTAHLASTAFLGAETRSRLMSAPVSTAQWHGARIPGVG